MDTMGPRGGPIVSKTRISVQSQREGRHVRRFTLILVKTLPGELQVKPFQNLFIDSLFSEHNSPPRLQS